MTFRTAIPILLAACLMYSATFHSTTFNNASAVMSTLNASTQSPPSEGLPTANPNAVGMSETELARIRPTMQAYIDDGRLAGIMTMVARRGHIVHWDAVGVQDADTKTPLHPDDIFRIFSMTKPITSTAVMMLVEEGKIRLDDPVERFVPEFSDVSVWTDDGDRVPADKSITIKHLLTHTSGLTYGFFADSPVDRIYNESGVMSGTEDLEHFAARVAELPLIANPGARWNYSASTDILGRVVEVASGQKFDQFLQERIFTPLSMTDTAFYVSEDKRNRFTANHARMNNTLAVTDSPDTGRYTQPPVWLSGGGGLISTASDYIRFAQMLLQEGHLNDSRILAEDTVRNMRTNHLPDDMVPIQLGTYLSPAYGFGLGFSVVVDQAGSPEPDNNGVFRWAGAANTFFWIDPQEELIGMVWMQMVPFAAYNIEREFQTLVYNAIQ